MLQYHDILLALRVDLQLFPLHHCPTAFRAQSAGHFKVRSRIFHTHAVLALSKSRQLKSPCRRCLDVCAELDEAPCIKSACDWVNSTCAKSEHLVTYCDSSYSLFAWTFGIVMMGVACLDLSFLSAIQGCLSVFAFSALTVMVATCVIAINTDTGDDVGWDAIPQTDLSGLGQLITCAVTSQLCHQVIAFPLNLSTTQPPSVFPVRA